MNPWRASNRHPHDCIHCKIHHNHPDSIHTSTEIRPDSLIETLANQSTDTLRQTPDTGRPTQVRYTQGHTQTHIQRLADTHRVTSMDTLGHKVRLWDPTQTHREVHVGTHTVSCNHTPHRHPRIHTRGTPRLRRHTLSDLYTETLGTLPPQR